MSIHRRDDNDIPNKNIATDVEVYYEELASQEEIYLEETEEELRVMLVSSKSDKEAIDTLRAVSTTDAQLSAAEELITGDADAPPLSKEAISEMLQIAAIELTSDPSCR